MLVCRDCGSSESIHWEAKVDPNWNTVLEVDVCYCATPGCAAGKATFVEEEVFCRTRIERDDDISKEDT